MTTWIKFGLFCVILVAISPLAAADSTWYIEADTGTTSFSSNSDTYRFDSSLAPPAGTNTAATYSDQSSGSRFTVGRFIPEAGGIDFGYELSYVDLGQATASKSWVVYNLGGCHLLCSYSNHTSGTMTARGWSVAGLLATDLSDRWRVYLRGGATRARAELETTLTSVPLLTGVPGGGSISTDHVGSGVGWTYGYGMHLAITPQWAAHLSWDRYKKIGGSNYWAADVDLVSLGLEYSL